MVWQIASYGFKLFAQAHCASRPLSYILSIARRSVRNNPYPLRKGGQKVYASVNVHGLCGTYVIQESTMDG